MGLESAKRIVFILGHTHANSDHGPHDSPVPRCKALVNATPAAVFGLAFFGKYPSPGHLTTLTYAIPTWDPNKSLKVHLYSILYISIESSKIIPFLFLWTSKKSRSPLPIPRGSGTRGNVNLPAARSAAVLLRSAFSRPSWGHHPTDLNLEILETPGAANPMNHMNHQKESRNGEPSYFQVILCPSPAQNGKTKSWPSSWGWFGFSRRSKSPSKDGGKASRGFSLKTTSPQLRGATAT